MSLIDRKVCPEPKNWKELVYPEFSEYQLPSGTKVIYTQKPKLPITIISFMVEAGSKYDPAGGEGLAHLTALLLDEGAGDWDALELNAILEKRGLSLKVDANADFFTVSITGLSEDMNLMLKILSAVIFEPHFLLEDFERERDRMRNNIKQNKSHPQAMASFLFNKIVQGRKNNYCYLYATEESIENITLSDVTFFHAENIEPIKPVITVVSDLQYDLIEMGLTEHFNGKLGIHDPQPADSNYALKDLRIFILDRKGSSQTEIFAGVPIPRMGNGKRDYAITLVNTIFGGNFNSRLNKNLREEKGFTYGVSSYFRPFKDSTQFFTYTSVDTANTGASLLEILKEMNNIRKDISEEELEFAKQIIVRGHPFMFETYGYTASLMNGLVSRELPLSYYDSSGKEYLRVTLEEAFSAAKELMLLENLQIVFVGDYEEIIKTIPQPLLRGVVEVNEFGRVLIKE
jgi:predicted Zn-dependent peptidase